MKTNLARVTRAMISRPVSQTTLSVAFFFVGASALAIAAPGAFYDGLLKPSLIALWVAQLLVLVVYP